MTKNEMFSLLREAEEVLFNALAKGVSGAEETHRKVALALRSEAAATPDGVCVTCGEAITQPATGRPRMYCGEACKKRAYRSKRAQREG
jgi:hypothetical protein